MILPGLDGSGELLEEFAASLAPEFSPRIVSYPPSGRLAYPELTELALAHVPDDRPFILIAESFSGPVGIQLAALRPAGLAGLVLCATFAAAPRAWAQPLRPVLALPIPIPPASLLMPLMMGRWSTPRWRHRLQTAISGVSGKVLRHRLAEVLRVDVRPQLSRIECPVLYLQASGDRLVPDSCWRAIGARLPAARLAMLEGPHFLLQHQPVLAAEAIKRHFQPDASS